MRFKPNKRQTETFLVLPLLEKSNNNNKNLIGMPKNPGLKLFTKTWNPKRTKKDDDKSRPLTATLEKPTILDISFLGVIDMSTMTKEFLNITNLCRLPLAKTIKKKSSTSKFSAPPSRPLSLPGCKPSVVVSDEESTRSSGKIVSGNKNIKSLKDKRHNNLYDRGETSIMKVTVSMTRQGMDSNNNRMKHSRRAPGKLLDRVKTPLSVGKMSSLPVPCTTCGRPDHPERLHSHPPTPVPKTRGKESTPPPRAPVKSSVQRPMAIKYKSRQLETSSMNPRVTPPQSGGPASGDAPDVPKSAGKRTLTCHLCGREFGTASLAIHQPKCLQKWHRENANLPPHLRRQLPPKPDHNLSREEWDRFAWESSQKNLVACSNCGRTFYPESLIVHQRSCKSLNDLGAVNELYKEVFPKSPPARSAVQVARLPMNANVEIEAIAGVPQSCSCGPISPSTNKPSCNL